MKKSKKALLWTIVPVLGVSSGVAGAVAGVTNQKTSVDTNNVATSSTATTMATRSTSNTDGLKIEMQPSDKITFSGESADMATYVKGDNIKYVWKVDKGSGWYTLYSGSHGRVGIDVDKTDVLLNWKFKCEIEDKKTGLKATTREAILTIAPKEGRNITITKQPESEKTVASGEKVVLTTQAEGRGEFIGKQIGYQWFEYDASTQEFVEIEDANSSSYEFTAPSYTTKQTKRYICRYYIDKGDGSKTYLSQSNQSVVTINKDTKEEIKVTYLNVDKKEVKVGDEVTLSAIATSTKTKVLEYQWYKADVYGNPYSIIDGAKSSEYKYKTTADDAGKTLYFCVLVTGTIQDGKLNHFQSRNLEVKVSSSGGTLGASTNEVSANKLSVTSSVTTNQASVRSTFYPVSGIRTPQYSVDVKGVESASELTYEWYYVGRDKKENLISKGTSSVLTTNKSLYEKVYKDNSNHKVEIMCKIYKDGELVETVSQKTDSRFYMTVVITRK